MQEHPFSAESLRAIAHDLQALAEAETAVVALAEAEGETIFYAAAVGKHAAAVEGKRGEARTSGLCGAAFLSKQPELVCEARGDLRVRQDLVEALNITTALAVPIEQDGQLIGALMVLNRNDGRAFDEEDRARLVAYAREVAPRI